MSNVLMKELFITTYNIISVLKLYINVANNESIVIDVH